MKPTKGLLVVVAMILLSVRVRAEYRNDAGENLEAGQGLFRVNCSHTLRATFDICKFT